MSTTDQTTTSTTDTKTPEEIVADHGPAIREMAREDTAMAPVARALLHAAGETDD
ncbi:hypothetical protein [Haloarchaeobius sp. HRN-SO-5]|uniref:hypothetical protein n=1 Tax=Haloarchaeobius sp. HRN-SO-5 TaxID=3446118 RepID=UPI003EB9ABB8